jgi:hypothetical protein
MRLYLTLMSWLLLYVTATGFENYYRVSYPASATPDQLALEATYTLWIPEDVPRLRAVIVHQHGCGFAANSSGETAAHDLHWQALARKWHAALLSPHYRQTEQGRDACHLWSDPRRGSRATLLKALDEFAEQSRHPELSTVPWCLWGHSGGASWVSVMQTLDPHRIVAAWLRSGTAFPMWESGEFPKPVLQEAVFRIPTMLNPGIKESTDGRPVAAWLGSAAMFKEYRSKFAPIGFAADPLSGHDCGNSRYLAIPYFDACLELRLPPVVGENLPLRMIDLKAGWLADLMGRVAVPAAEYKGKVQTAVWLPNERIAKAWMEYVATGEISDHSPPPAPMDVTTSKNAEGHIVVSWKARADFESGLHAFRIYRNDQRIAQVPEKPIGVYGRPLFQTMSSYDTPEKPLPSMVFVDTSADANSDYSYRVTAINGVGIESPKSAVQSHQSR